jgi:hypothetical protein
MAIEDESRLNFGKLRSSGLAVELDVVDAFRLEFLDELGTELDHGGQLRKFAAYLVVIKQGAKPGSGGDYCPPC